MAETTILATTNRDAHGRGSLLAVIAIGVVVGIPLGIVFVLSWPHGIPTTVQLVGGLITGTGLLLAYLRVKRIGDRFREWYDRYSHRQRQTDTSLDPISAMLNLGFTLSAEGYVEFRFDENATDERKFAQLEEYVRDLRALFDPVNGAVIQLSNAIKEAKTQTDAAAEQALAQAKAELKSFGDEFNRTEGFDLAIAAAGAFVMVLGYALSYLSYFR